MKKTSTYDMDDRKNTVVNLQDREQDNLRRDVLRRIVRNVRKQNADLSEDEAMTLANEAVAAVRTSGS
jgi:hypothetical protein